MRLLPRLTPDNLFKFMDENRIWDYDSYDKDQVSPYMWCVVMDSDFHLQFARRYENPPELRINPEGSRTRDEIILTLNDIWKQKDDGRKDLYRR